MLNFSSLMMGSSKPKALMEYYQKVLGKKVDWSDNDWYGFQVGNTSITIGPHSEVKGKAKEPQRLIINFETKEVKKEFDRIKATGAEVVKEPYEMGGMWIATFADPEGNYFQLVPPWENK